MDTVTGLLSDIGREGVRLSIVGGRLVCLLPRRGVADGLVERIRARHAELHLLLARHAGNAVTVVENPQTFTSPLTDAQQRLWFIQQLDPSSIGYQIAGAVRIGRCVDAQLLQSALDRVAARHSALRTTFTMVDGEPLQVVHASLPIALQTDDVRSHENPEREARRLCESLSLLPFDLERGPLLRGRLVQVADQAFVLMIGMHHIVSDGWSIGILIRELAAMLDGGTAVSLTKPLQFTDYVAWDRRHWGTGEQIDEALGYWCRNLAGMNDMAVIEPDGDAVALPGAPSATHAFRIDSVVTSQLRVLAQRTDATLFMVLTSLVTLWVSRHSGHADVCVGTAVSNRPTQEFADVIGMFVNTLPLRTHVADDMTFLMLLESVRDTCIEAFDRAGTPFARIVDAVNPSRRRGANPFFQVMTVLQQHLEMPGSDVSVFDVAAATADFDLSVEFTETPTGLDVLLQYRCDLFGTERARTMGRQLVRLVQAIAGRPASRLSDVDMLGPDRQALLDTCQGDTRMLPATAGVHHLVAELSRTHGSRTALRTADADVDYASLRDEVVRMASGLRRAGVEPGDVVGLCGATTPILIAGMLAVMEVGAAFLPLDPAYPVDRLRHMVIESRARHVLVDNVGARSLASLEAVFEALSLTRLAAEEADMAAMPPVCHDDIAYVIYTSGSTGLPKGVPVSHAGLLNHNLFAREHYGLSTGDVQLQSASISFDLFVEEVFTILASGACLVLLPREQRLDARSLLSAVEYFHVTVLNFPTALFHAVAHECFGADTIRTIIVGGERLDADLARSFLMRHPGVSLYNTYGPTETTIISTSERVDPATLKEGLPIPIGRPIANTRVYILDGSLRLVPPGTAGEIYIAGSGVSPGYLNRPDLTVERFLADPFMRGQRMYRTGDKARRWSDGRIEYLGRLDDQVKIRGHRVETAEIEAVLLSHAAIGAAAVVVQGPAQAQRLVAFVVPIGEIDGTVESALRHYLAERLPTFMLPAGYVTVDALPLTPGGKVDRRALEHWRAVDDGSDSAHIGLTAPQAALAAIWADITGAAIHTIGVDTDFFEVGGHSLTATRVIARIEQTFGIVVPLRAVFDYPTLSDMAALVARGSTAETVPLVRVERGHTPPLSLAQERLWFLQMLDPASHAYNMPGAARITGQPLDRSRLERVLGRLLQRHENLRICVDLCEGVPRQVIFDNALPAVGAYDLSAFPPEAALAEARALCMAEAMTPFDLSTGPLLRCVLIRLADDDHVLMLNMHHIVSDGWSVAVLLGELGTLLADPDATLPALPVQYADYAVWQRRWLEEGGALERQLGYWKQQLAGLPESLELLPDFPRPAERGSAGASVSFVFDPAVLAGLRQVAETQGATLYMTLLGLVATLLYRYTGQDDLCLGSPIANRRHAETEGIVGMFVNTLPLRVRLDGEAGFAALLGEVMRTCLDAYEHQDTPFERVVEAVRPQRSRAISPLFQVMVILQNNASVVLPSGVEPFDLDHEVAKFDLSIEFEEEARGLRGTITYATDLYRAGRIERMVQHLQALGRAAVAEPSRALASLAYLADDERTQLLDGFNATACDYPREHRIHDFVLDQMARTPDRPAVVADEGTLTYAELDARSASLACYLQAQGVGPDTIVGVCMERSLAMVVAILGIVRAGAAYLPLDPEYPADRLGYMLGDSATPVVLTQVHLRDMIAPLLDAATSLCCLDSEWDTIEAAAGHALRDDVRADHLCYVIYTSGSTGRPKGVLNEHRGLVNRLVWMQRAYALTYQDVVLQKTPYSFDVSVWEFFWPLMTGASLVVAAPGGHRDVAYLDRVIATHGVTTLHFVPSMLTAFLENGDTLHRSVARVICSGEALGRKAATTYRERFPEASLYNLYGPTEAAIDVTAHDCATLPPGHVPIGQPIDNLRIYVLDRLGSPQPVGVPGELHIAGDGLARGYLNRPELTQDRFVADPFVPGKRMYRSGDLVRWDEEGTIEYLGRIDTQVKLRGLRIELGEIESQLEGCPGVEVAVVVLREERLVAFCTAKATATIDPEALRGHLARSLPEYMIPAHIVPLDALPLTSSGKADRRALTQLPLTLRAVGHVAPRSEPEARMAAIWADVLSLPVNDIGVDDDFFDIGGHSLLATRLVARIRQAFAVELPLRCVFDAPTVSALLAQTRNALPATVVSMAGNRPAGDLPLSFAQERIWFLHQLEPGEVTYAMPAAARLARRVEPEGVKLALTRLLARHEALRTVFDSVDGHPVQRILAHVPLVCRVHDLSAFPPEAALAEARALCMAEAMTPFDLSTGPLLRCVLIRLADDDHVLMLNMHHIVSDGWSVAVLLGELGTLLADPDATLPALPVQYADYAVWQRRWLEEGGALERQLGYWKQQLAGLPESLELLPDFPRPAERGSAGASVSFVFDPAVLAGLRQVAETQGATLYMTLLGLVATLLYRYTGQDDLCLGSPIANRRHAETEGIVGMFVNTLPLRVRLDGEAGFAALLGEVMRTCLDAYEHQDTPFERVVEAVRPQRSRAISPLFQVMVILQNNASVVLPSGVEPFDLDHEVAKFDLSIEFEEEARGLRGTITYATDLYRAGRIERMVQHLQALGRAAVAEPSRALASLAYLADDERTQLLDGFNATACDYPREHRIHDFVLDQMARTPDRPAVVADEGTLTYAELDARSASLACYLQAQGVGPDTIVGVCMERSLAMVVAILGIVRAGAAYLPLDPEYPADRLGYMLGDSATPVVLTQVHLRDMIAPLLDAATSLCCLDSEWDTIEAAAGHALRDDVRADHLCYVLYTSGSTGLPKGVLTEHRALVNQMHWRLCRYGLHADDVVLQKTPYSFDVSVWEFFWPLMVGAHLVVAAPGGHRDVAYLTRLIAERGVTTLHFVPSMVSMFLEHAAAPLPSVTHLFCGGEAMPRKIVDEVATVFPSAHLYNLYGPTEAAIDVTEYECEAEVPAVVPIGRPLHNTRLYIVDERHQPLPIGIPGELFIAGENLARGYLNRPELTEERFVPDPFVAGQRMYRSGDLARWHDDGTIEYLGRIDHQVKLRGLRIELGEIEACIETHEGVEKAVVVAQGDGADRRLVAFVRMAASADATGEALREHVLLRLPRHMVPSAFVGLVEWPVTTSGKTDRRVLERMEVAMDRVHQRVAPTTDDDQRMVAIWADVLGLPADAIGMDDDFFELGGHSLLAVRLMALVERAWHRALPLATLFTAPTVAALVRQLSETPPAQGVLVPIQPHGSQPPIFVVPGVGGNVLSFRAFATACGDDQPVYGLQATGLDGVTAPASSVRDAALINAQAILAASFVGPYRLLGHSFGGVVAFETARALMERGQSVESVALLDAFVQAPPDAIDEDAASEFHALCRQIGEWTGKVVDISVQALRETPPGAWTDLLAAAGLDVGTQQLEALRGVLEANRRAYAAYVPAPLPDAARVTLYRAARETRSADRYAPDHGWSAWLGYSPAIVDVDAGHFSMLDAPAAALVADAWRQIHRPSFNRK